MAGRLSSPKASTNATHVPMLAFNRRAAAIVWTAGLVLLAFYLAFAVRQTIFVFLLALFVAYMVAPLVRRLLRLAPRLSRNTAVAIVFVVLTMIAVLVLAVTGPRVAEQSKRFVEQLPALLNDTNLSDRIPMPDWLAPYRSRVVEFVRERMGDGSAYAAPVAKNVGRFVLAAGGSLILVVLIPILAFLMLVNGPAIRSRFLAWARQHRHPSMWRGIVDDLDTLLGGYIRALVILALATIVCYSVAFSLFGLPYSLLLALVAGALEFIPVLGPLTAAVLIVAVAALSGFGHLLWLVGFIALYRIFQDYVLNPYLMSNGVSVPALLVLFGLLAGEELAGVAGVFLSTPVLAAALILSRRITAASRVAETLDERAGGAQDPTESAPRSLT
jgi:predicted PurR-regulated permease PerM